MVEVVNLTHRYENTRGYDIDRTKTPVTHASVHHAAGTYGVQLDSGTSREREIEFLDALARDHAIRFGVAPGYSWAAFPATQRLYRLHPYNSSLASVIGRNPANGENWNATIRSLVFPGDYTTLTAGENERALIEAFLEGVGIAPAYLLGHGEHVSVNSAGVDISTRTACPGTLQKVIDDIRKGYGMSNTSTYVVRAGDTLSEIAMRFGVANYKDILRWSGLPETLRPERLQIGTVLTVKRPPDARDTAKENERKRLSDEITRELGKATDALNRVKTLSAELAAK